MNDEFRLDLILKTLVQEKQFEQWLKTLFYLNEHLIEKYDSIYQESFYVKFYEVITVGLIYANELLKSLEKTDNYKKSKFYKTLIDESENLKSCLSEAELVYIEYRRHSACHIFQDGYEHIQGDFKIKTKLKDKTLEEVNSHLQSIIKEHGNDRNVDDYLNLKLQKKLTDLYIKLT